MAISAGKLWGLRRLADQNGRFKMLAIDQRPPIINLVKERRGVTDADRADVIAVKRALATHLAPEASAVLLDPDFAYPAVIDRIAPRQGVLHTLEGYDFESTSGGRRTSEIDGWSVAKIRRAGGDAVKLLVWYRPDADPDICRHQQALVRRAADACRQHDLPFVLEMLLYPLTEDDQAGLPVGRRIELVHESVRTFAATEYGVDLFKLESPVPAADVPDPRAVGDPEVKDAQRPFTQMAELAGRPWVMLSAGAGQEAFRRVLTYAYRAGASGFLAGRAIWWQAAQRFPDTDAMAAELGGESVAYMRAICDLTDRLAPRWTEHPCFGDAGPTLADGGEGWSRRYLAEDSS